MLSELMVKTELVRIDIHKRMVSLSDPFAKLHWVTGSEPTKCQCYSAGDA